MMHSDWLSHKGPAPESNLYFWHGSTCENNRPRVPHFFVISLKPQKSHFLNSILIGPLILVSLKSSHLLIRLCCHFGKAFHLAGSHIPSNCIYPLIWSDKDQNQTRSFVVLERKGLFWDVVRSAVFQACHTILIDNECTVGLKKFSNTRPIRINPYWQILENSSRNFSERMS